MALVWIPPEIDKKTLELVASAAGFEKFDTAIRATFRKIHEVGGKGIDEVVDVEIIGREHTEVMTGTGGQGPRPVMTYRKLLWYLNNAPNIEEIRAYRNKT